MIPARPALLQKRNQGKSQSRHKHARYKWTLRLKNVQPGFVFSELMNGVVSRVPWTNTGHNEGRLSVSGSSSRLPRPSALAAASAQLHLSISS